MDRLACMVAEASESVESQNETDLMRTGCALWVPVLALAKRGAATQHTGHSADKLTYVTVCGNVCGMPKIRRGGYIFFTW